MEVAIRQGVGDVVLSPGSRNAPLVMAFTAREDIRRHVVIDERSAAFVALGIAQVSGRPVALACTSGTALLNYAPAVAEAYYQALPLIVISADRPHEWIDQDDSQTLHQYEALSNFVKRSYDISDADSDWFANRTANDAMLTATAGRPGPVHINVQLSAPLNMLADCPGTDEERIIRILGKEDAPRREDIDRLARQAAGKRILVVAGFMPPSHRLNNAMAALTALPEVAIMYETLSNLHLGARQSLIDVTLSAMTPGQKEQLRPDIVISLGGALVSRFVKQYLRTYSPAEHWNIGQSHTTVDCFGALTLRVESNPASFIRRFAAALRRHRRDISAADNYKASWDMMRDEALRSHRYYLASAPWSDLSAMELIMERVPDNCNIQLSNGTPVRYAQLLTIHEPHASYCNRGVSGIDGCTSTAVGASLAYNGITLLITGDMSMSYDLSGLALPLKPSRLRIIVLNNGGGGIFRFIEATRQLPCREEYLCADPKLDIKGVAQTFGFSYMRADSKESLIKALDTFYELSDTPALLEVVTNPDTSAEVLTGYMNRTKNE